MANNQNFIVKHGLTVGANQVVIDSNGNWVGPQTAYANASFSVANIKTHIYTQETPPATANVNDVWIDSANGVQYINIQDTDSTQWVEFGPIGSPTGNIVFSDQTIIGSVSNRDVTIQQQGTGNLNIRTTNTYVYGTIHVTSNTFSSTDSLLNIVGSDGDRYQLPANPGTMIHVTGKANTPSRIVNDSFGVGAYGLFASRTARGTASNPLAVQAGDVIARYSGSAHDGTSFPALGVGRIDIVSTENHTTSNKGSEIQFWSTVKGSNTLTKIATFDGSKANFIGTIVSGGGFAFEPRVDASNNTTQTINFTTDSFVRINANNDTTISPTGFLAGKVIEVFITNFAGSTKTITHGLAANNSTIGSTSKQMAAGSTMYLKYISYDGDLSNTFVTVSYN